MKKITIAVVCFLYMCTAGFSQNKLSGNPDFGIEKSLFPVSEQNLLYLNIIKQYIFPDKLKIELGKTKSIETRIRESVLSVSMKSCSLKNQIQ